MPYLPHLLVQWKRVCHHSVFDTGFSWIEFLFLSFTSFLETTIYITVPAASETSGSAGQIQKGWWPRLRLWLSFLQFIPCNGNKSPIAERDCGARLLKYMTCPLN